MLLEKLIVIIKNIFSSRHIHYITLNHAHTWLLSASNHKAGKLIRLRAEVHGEAILDLRISGDFFIIPKEAMSVLEDRLIGKKLEEDVLFTAISAYYEEDKPESPGVTPRDLTDAFMKLKALL